MEGIGKLLSPEDTSQHIPTVGLAGLVPRIGIHGRNDLPYAQAGRLRQLEGDSAPCENMCILYNWGNGVSAPAIRV
jgi:hypothetical protein